jgi:hypothetical protein
MSKNGYTVKAFSMIEAIVGMAVTAIIISIIFTIFSIMSEILADFKEQNEETADISRLSFAISRDMFESQSMSASAFKVEFGGYSGESSTYLLGDKYILRQTEVSIDTFKLKPGLISIDTLSSPSGKIVYECLKVSVLANGRSTGLSFHRRVYANQLMDAEQ